MEALIPAPTDCEVRSVIKFLNAQSIVPIEIHCQLCQVYGHMAQRWTHLLQEFTLQSRTSGPVISILSYTSRNSCPNSVSIFRIQRSRDECHSGSNPKQQISMTQDTNVSIPEVNMSKNSSTLAVSVPINLLIKLGFVSVNGPRETYFVDALRRFCSDSDLFKPDEIGKLWHMIFCQMSVTLFARILF